MIMHIASPYPAHRSALPDCTKVVTSQLGDHEAVLIYGYDYLNWPMDPVVNAFETPAWRQIGLSDRSAAAFDGLVYPILQRGRVFGWAIHQR
jgi:hypothetical protein